MHSSATSSPSADGSGARLVAYLADCRELVEAELRRILPASRFNEILYRPLFEGPITGGQWLRSGLVIAVCRALGGRLEAVLPTAAVLELYHRAHLVHADTESGAIRRRGFPTLHDEHGPAIALNGGDALLALTLEPLLTNLDRLGLGTALRILQVVARMAREASVGRALELAWPAGRGRLTAEAYHAHIVYRRYSWTSFIAPVAVGAIAGGAARGLARGLRALALDLGLACKLRDELWAPRRDPGAWLAAGPTLAGTHALVPGPGDADAERVRAVAVRPSIGWSDTDRAFVSSLVERHGGVPYAAAVQARIARRAAHRLWRWSHEASPSVHNQFLTDVLSYATLGARNLDQPGRAHAL